MGVRDPNSHPRPTSGGVRDLSLLVGLLLCLGVATSAVHTAEVDDSEPLGIQVGQTIRADMPAGDPEAISVAFELTARADGPLTVETYTLHFDTILEITRDDGGSRELVGWDYDGGVGFNSRFTLRAEAGARYRIKVRSFLDDWGGPFQLAIAPGEAPAPDWERDRAADFAYWDAVEAEGEAHDLPVLAAYAARGRAAWHRGALDYDESRSEIERARELFGELLGSEHPTTVVCTAELAFSLQDRGFYQESKELLEEARDAFIRQLGSEHWYTLLVQLMAARTAGQAGEHARAIELLREHLSVLEEQLGSEHPLYRYGQYWLAQQLYSQGSYAESLELFEDIRDGYREWYGPGHEMTLGMEFAVADVVNALGEPTRAIELDRQNLQRYEERLGSTHPWFLSQLGGLAQRLFDRGSYAEALELFERVREGYRELYGPGHEQTLWMELAVADVVNARGEPARAVELYDEYLPRLEERLGEGHPWSLYKRRVLAARLYAQGNAARAREMFENALSLAEADHGPESLELAWVHDSFGSALWRAGATREAVPHHERAVAIFRVRGNAIGLADGTDNLAADLKRLGETDSAQELYEEALAINRRSRPDSIAEALDHWSLGLLLRDKEETDLALAHFERYLDIWRRRLGPGRGVVGLSEVFKIYAKQDEQPKARERFAQFVAKTEHEYGADSVEVAKVLSAYGSAFCAAGMTDDARTTLEDAHERLAGHLGGSDPATLQALSNLGRLCCHGEWEHARAYFERMVRLYSARLGTEHPDTLTIRFTLADVLEEAGEGDRALETYREYLPVYERALGPEHDACLTRLKTQAQALYDRGLYTESLPLWNRLADIYASKYGPEHKDTLDLRFAAADALHRTGEQQAARQIYADLLPLYERLLGPYHSDFRRRLGVQAREYRKLGRLQEALDLYERLAELNEGRYGSNHRNTLDSHFRAADTLYELDQHDLAIERYRRHLPALQEAVGVGSTTFLEKLRVQAVRLDKSGHEQEARELFEEALRGAETDGGPDVENATVLEYYGLFLETVGSFEESLARFQDALAIREQELGPTDPSIAANLGLQTRPLDAMARFEEAVPLMERAVEIAERHYGSGSIQTAGHLMWLGLELHRSGRYAEAKPFLERNLEITRRDKGPGHVNTGWALGALSMLLMDMGAYDEARRNFEEILAIRERVDGPDSQGVASVLGNLGRANNHLGNHAEALAIFERVRQIREEPDAELTGGVGGLAVALVGMAEAHKGLGHLAEARSLLEQALAIQEEYHEKGSPVLADIIARLATIHLETSSLEKARELYERAVELTEDELGPEHPDLAERLTGLARADLLLGEYDDALDEALRAETIGRGHLRETARAVTEGRALSLSAVRASGLGLAVSVAVESGDAVPDAATATWDAVIASRAVVLDEVATRHRRVASMARLAQGAADAATRLSDLTVRGRGELTEAEHERLLLEARFEKERADQALVQATAGLDSQRRGTTERGVRSVARNLPADSALVAYLRYDRELIRSEGAEPSPVLETVPSYAAFVVRRAQRESSLVPLASAAEVEAAVEAWRRAVGPESVSKPARSGSDYRAAGEALRRAIWDPLAAQLGEEVERVIVVPDGALNLVNLAALPVGESGYLIESGPLFHYVSAERDLIPTRREGSEGRGLLAMGGPDFDEPSLFAQLRTEPEDSPEVIRIASAAVYRGKRSACSDFDSMSFEPLPGTVGEVEGIVALWRDAHGIAIEGAASAIEPTGDTAVEHLGGARANETAFKELAPGNRILHLATHGFFLGGQCASALEPSRGIGGLASAEPEEEADPPEEEEEEEKITEPREPENPLLLSGLVLAGANHRSAAGPAEDDGILTAEEIAALDLSGVEWAVLSACDTGVGDIRAGEGVFGLRRAFQVAGVGTLIMSLWSVEDEATREWMTALYEARLERRLDTAEAVREASLSVLRHHRETGQSTHPFYWASFVAAGDWR